MHMTEVQGIRGEDHGPKGAGTFVWTHASRASKLDVREFRCSDDLDWFRQVAENGL